MEKCSVCGSAVDVATLDQNGICPSCRARASGEAPPTATNAPSSAVSSAANVVSPPTAPPARKRRWPAILLVLAALVLIGGGVGIGLSMSGVAGGGPVRGYASTVVRYADRSYEGASWQVVRKATSLGDLSRLGSSHDVAELSRIYGYDEDNLWIIDGKGAIFHLDQGHWELEVVLPEIHDRSHPPHGAVLDRDTLLIGGGRAAYENFVHRIGPEGVEKFALQYDEDVQGGAGYSLPLRGGDAIIPLAPGVTYLATGSIYVGTSHKFAEGQLHVLRPAKAHQDAVVVDADGTPLRLESGRYLDVPTVQDFWLSATFEPFEATAVARFENSRDDPPMLVDFRSNAWARIEDIPLEDPATYRTGWLSRDDAGRHFCVFVGPGRAAVYRQGQGVTVIPLNVSPAMSDGDLVQVWGTGPEHYWVMDRTGSVWERRDREWHPIVRGLYENDIHFNHSWVSPEGTVYAITDDSLYKLDQP